MMSRTEQWTEGKKVNNQIPLLGLNEYSRLRHVARCLISRESVCTLTATGLVHELLIKDSQTRREASNSSSGTKPGVVLPYASRVMKQLLIDRARKRMTRRKLETKAQDEANARHQRAAQFAVELDDTIAQLGTEMPDSAELVRLHLYGELSIEDAAQKLGLSRATAYRKWAFCKSWLARRLDTEA